MKEVTYKDWVKNPTPRMMWVWDSIFNNKKQRKVIYFLDPKILYPIVALSEDEMDIVNFEHCAEIEKQRRMTNKELSRWLKEHPSREYKYSNSIERSVYSVYTYFENCGDEEVRDDIVIREDYGEWREPLVEVAQ